MGKKDPRVDAYIRGSADFAKPILSHLRAVVHEACPGVEEPLKWSSPSFSYKGLLCGMNAFKEYCTFGFWKSSPVRGPEASRDPALQFDRITAVSELPSKKVLKDLVKKAMALNDAGVTMARKSKRAPRPVIVPAAL